MDIRKGYKMLVMALFVAFISLISRSIIYLILSVSVAAILIFLLSSDKKITKTKVVKGETVIVKESNKRLTTFLWTTTIVGGLSLGYGSLFFTSGTIFHQIIPLPEQLFSSIVFISVGFCAVLGSLYFLIREGLTIKTLKASPTPTVFCGKCGEPNKGDHAYCFSCGQKLP